MENGSRIGETTVKDLGCRHVKVSEGILGRSSQIVRILLILWGNA